MNKIPIHHLGWVVHRLKTVDIPIPWHEPVTISADLASKSRSRPYIIVLDKFWCVSDKSHNILKPFLLFVRPGITSFITLVGTSLNWVIFDSTTRTNPKSVDKRSDTLGVDWYRAIWILCLRKVVGYTTALFDFVITCSMKWNWPSTVFSVRGRP